MTFSCDKDVLKILKGVICTSDVPLILPGKINDWNLLSWTFQDWCNKIGRSRNLPFRCGKKKFSVEPQWESSCPKKEVTLEQFLHLAEKESDEWLYFDYKHLSEWFSSQPELLEGVDWSSVGFPERSGKDSTLWIGSKGAHTPCHVDTYGFNLVAQIHGQKQWILFPPGSDKFVKATRVPYEESSVYSDLNFYSPPKDLKFTGAHVVTLNPGDVLFVPNGWWHYVETMSTVAISINTWIPLPSDKFRNIEESIVKMWVAAVGRFTPNIDEILNPNETDVLEDKNILEYVKWSTQLCTESEQTEEGEPPQKKVCTSQTKMTSDSNFIKLLDELEEDRFMDILNGKRERFADADKNEPTKISKDSEFSKKLINAMCKPNVLALIANNLLTKI